MQVIGVYRKFKNRVVTLLVVSAFNLCCNKSPRCVKDLRDSTAAFKFNSIVFEMRVITA